MIEQCTDLDLWCKPLPEDTGLLAGAVVSKDEQGWVQQISHYQAGQLVGATTSFGPIGEPLFALEPAQQSALDQGAIATLQPLFQAQGVVLAAAAAIALVTPNVEWLITQADRAYTVRKTAQALTVFPGRVQQVVNFTQGQPDGATLLYAAGQVSQVLSFKAGKLDGPLTQYAAGKPQTMVTYVNGAPDGPTIIYDKQGQATVIAPYQAGKLAGPLVLYNQGQPQSVVNYKADQEDGESIVYYPNGQLSLVAHYQANVLEGAYLLYYQSGQLFKQACYAAGKLEGETLEYYPSGALREQAHYHAGQLEGTVCTYDEQGNLKQKRAYHAGKEIPPPVAPAPLVKSTPTLQPAPAAVQQGWTALLMAGATLWNPGWLRILLLWQQLTSRFAKSKG